jgi:hypothetical protein
VVDGQTDRLEAGTRSVTMRSTAESGQTCPNVTAPSLVWSARRRRGGSHEVREMQKAEVVNS